jgi:hypothetical protein
MNECSVDVPGPIDHLIRLGRRRSSGPDEDHSGGMGHAFGSGTPPPDLEAEKVVADTARVVRVLRLAENHLLGVGNGAGSAGLDDAIEQMRHAIDGLTHLQGRLEALQWDRESEEMDAELLRRGYVRTAPDEWTSPADEKGLSQLQALLRVDEELAGHAG